MTCSCEMFDKTIRPEEGSGGSQVAEDDEKCGECSFKPQMEDLTPLEFVCRGPGGSINKSTHQATGKRLIVKTMKVNRRLQARIDREVELSLSLRHPQLIETYNAVYRDENRFLYMIQNYYEGGDLLDYVMKHGPMRTCPDLARWVVACVARALVYMDERGVFHGDIKPENLLFESSPYHVPGGCHSNGVAHTSSCHGNDFTAASNQSACRFPNVRLIDFGHSQYTDEQQRTPCMFGTLEYSAPEVFAFAESRLVDGQAADVWSLGVTLFALLFGSLPWAEPSLANKDYAAFVRRYRDMHPQQGGSAAGSEDGNSTSAASAAAEGASDSMPSSSPLPSSVPSSPLPRRHGAVFDDDGVARLGITAHLCELFDGMLCPDAKARWTIHDVLGSELLRSKPWFVPHEEGQGGLMAPSSAADITPVVSVAG